MEDLRRMMGRVLDRQPGLVFDLMEEFPEVRLGLRGAPQPQQEQVPAPDWCRCSRCQEMLILLFSLI